MSQTLVAVYTNDVFQRRCELIAAKVAMDKLKASGVPVADKAMASQVLLRQISREDIAFAIVAAPDVAAAAVQDPGNPGAQVTDAMLADAFARNWSDFAAVRAG
jgi:hypothetical protein